MDERELTERIKWLEASVRRIAGSVSPPVSLPPHPYARPDDDLSDEVKQLVDSGNTMGAVQRHRQETGVSLSEAKQAVDAYSE